jgi:hypothetical protein
MLSEDDQFADDSSDDGFAPSQIYAARPEVAVPVPVFRPKSPVQAKPAPVVPFAVPPHKSPIPQQRAQILPAKKPPVIDLTLNGGDSSGDEKKKPKEKPPREKTPKAKKEKKRKAVKDKKAKQQKQKISPEAPPAAIVSKPGALVVPVSSVETQVCRATRLVAQELEYGGWREVSPGARQRAAVALEEFVRTVFLPNVLQKSNYGAPGRVFLATMLALREVLTQNAERVFHMEKVPLTGDELQDDAPGGIRWKTKLQEEERQYMAQLFATGVIFAAFQSLSPVEAEEYTTWFTKVMDSYDMGYDDFASCLEPLDGRHEGVRPNLTVLESEENVAWKVSYNRACEAHPVVRRSKWRQEVDRQRELGLASVSEPNTVEVPSPNAVLVTMVEKLSPKP